MRKERMICGAALAALTCSAAQAALTNPSFETGDMAGWSYASSGGYNSGAFVTDNVANQAQQYPPFNAVLPGTADGRYYAELSGFGTDAASYAWQDVGALAPDTTYSLTIAIGGSKFDWSCPVGTISLVNGTDRTGTVLASNSMQFGAYPGNFQDLTTSFTTGSSVGGDLTILVTTVGGFNNFNSLKYDNVRLATSAVPEPGTFGVIGLAVGTLLSVRRRSR